MEIVIKQHGIGGQKIKLSQHGKGAEHIFCSVYNPLGEMVEQVSMCADEFRAAAKALEELK